MVNRGKKMLAGNNVSAVAQQLPGWLKAAMGRTAAGKKLLFWGKQRAKFRQGSKYKGAFKRFRNLPKVLRQKIKKY